jgi:hypothetical protein
MIYATTPAALLKTLSKISPQRSPCLIYFFGFDFGDG